MTAKIDGTTIQLTRGDTLKIHLDLFNDDDTSYTPQTGDSIRFAMKKSYSDSTPILVKQIPLETMDLIFEPDDTKNLPQPSSYVYDVEMTYANGEVDTFITKAKFKITEEVH